MSPSPRQDVLRLTLVDGFAGGGEYFHSDTNELVLGSPFICLDAAREAETLLNLKRTKPLHFDINYFFIEANRNAYFHLAKMIEEHGYSSQLGNSIHLRQAKFQDEANSIIDFIKKKSPRTGRSIFVLDQYGYKDVPTGLIQNIFKNLPSAEIILTFGVDSFLNFASDKEITQGLIDALGIKDPWQGKSLQEIKSSDREWRLFIQSNLYRNLTTACGAEYFTPFFIRNKKGHGDYWLIHMSQHHRARDVMTEVHWSNQNHFIHYGGAGLNMFNMVGYDPDQDAVFTGQTELGFEFDDFAREASIGSLMKQIPRLIYADDSGLSFGELFAKTCNGTPASSSIYKEALGRLVDQKELNVVGVDGGLRRMGSRVNNSDQIIAPPQRSLIFID